MTKALKDDLGKYLYDPNNVSLKSKSLQTFPGIRINWGNDLKCVFLYYAAIEKNKEDFFIYL